jgi:hypothetical protein
MKNKYEEALYRVLSFIPSNFIWSDMDVKGLLEKLVDKETPMKPRYISLLTNPPQPRTICGNCKGGYLERTFNFCHKCGQRIDWSKDE